MVSISGSSIIRSFRSFFGLFALCFLLLSSASANDIPYRQYSLQDGLPHENISSIEQTPDGRIWVGTSAGLAFHTGLQFTSVRFLGSLGTVNVLEIEPTDNNEVWVATHHQGIWKVRFEHAKQPFKELSNVRARRLIERNDSLFVFSQDELWIVDLETNQVSKTPYVYSSKLKNNSPASANNRHQGIVSAEIAPDGTQWILHRQHGPGRVLDNGKIVFANAPGTENDEWYSIKFDNSGVGWITNEKKGLYRFDPNQNSLELVIRALGVRHICITPMMIAVTSHDHGTLYWNLMTNSQAMSLNERTGFPTNRVNCIFRDQEMNIWVGTQVGLIHMSHPGVNHLDNIEDTPLVNMFGIVKQGDQSIWAISQTEGVFQLSPEKKTAPLPMSRWTDFFIGHDDKLHIIGEMGWFSIDQDSVWEHVDAFVGGLKGNVDQTGTAYIKHEQGLFRHSPSHMPYQLLSWDPNEQDYFNHTLTETGDLLVWRNGELVQISKDSSTKPEDEIRLIRQIPSFQNHQINDMAVDSFGRTWLAVMNNGLLCIEPDTMMQLLPGHQINRLSVSGDSLLIASANEGLYVFNLPKKANAAKGIHLDEDASIRYHLTQADGLLSSIVSGAVFSEGSLWINHPGGVTRIPRSLLEREPPVPQVLLTGINYNGIDRPPNRPLMLSAVDRNIGFSFVAPSFSQPHRVQYRYRLKGYTEKWKNTDEPGVQFANLPAGDYTFEVQASASNLKYGMSALYDFSIPEPYYQRPYFWLSILLMSMLLMYCLHRYRLRSLLRVERTRTRIAMDLHDDIGSSLTSLSFLSNLAWQRTDNEKPKEEIAPLLKDISSMSSELVDNMLDIVWSVDPKHDSVGSVIGRLQAFYQRMSDAAEITLNWHIEEGVGEIALPPRSRRSLYMIMKEAINNAVKHSGTPVIDIRFDREFGILQIEVRDYGKGFDVNQLFSGYGLNTMRERAEEEGATLEINSKPFEETIVLLKWPIKANV